MTTFDLKAFNARRQQLANDAGRSFHSFALVQVVDGNNVILAWRDVDVFKGKAFDKYRIGSWYWSGRNSQWQQGNGALSCPYEQRAALIEALGNMPNIEHGRTSLAGRKVKAVA